MKTERDLFSQWVKKEYTHIFNGAEQGNVRFKMDIDFMYMAWKASASREGYKLVPVEPPEDMDIKICRLVDHRIDVFEADRIYKAMIGASE